jgi:formylglycine-generating enzyme required for sulfatase activity/serine/threonine protein kinase
MEDKPGGASSSRGSAERAEVDSSSIRFDFLDALARDRRAGLRHPLSHYLGRFPGHEETIAREFFRTEDERAEPSGEASPPSDPALRDGSTALQARLKSLAEPVPRGERYVREAVIGQGGMGVVHRVRDLELDRTLALKELRLDPAQLTPLAAARFLEEAQVTAQLDHAGIVAVHEVGVGAEGRLYFAMKLVRGRDLKSILELPEGAEGWSLPRFLTVLSRVCEAMAYAHSKGVIHRDLKPANVMVGHFGEVYVMDWGLALVLGRPDLHDLRLKTGPVSASVHTLRRESGDGAHDSPLVTMEGIALGTPSYMAPEQARGELERLSPRSDVYSIGAILYHVLGGEAPYVPRGARVSAERVLWRLIEGPPVPVTRLRPDIPAELVAIQERAMARDPAARYGDTGELAADLHAYLEQRVVRAYQTGALAELAKWTRRNRSLAASLAAIVLLLVVGLVITLDLMRDADHSRVFAQEQLKVAERQSDDLFRLSTFQRLDDLERKAARLWPAVAALLPEYDAWLVQARALVAELEPGADGRYLGHRAKLRELAGRARPATEAEVEEERQAHPRHAEIAALRRTLERTENLRRARAAGEAAPVDVGAEATAVEASFTGNALDACALAWPLVDPERAVFGQEARGLALAQRALEVAADEGEAARASEVLAWALFARGRDEDALVEMRTASALAEEAGGAPLPALKLLEQERVAVQETLRVSAARTIELTQLEEGLGQARFEDTTDRWWHDQLAKLVARLQALADPDTGLIDGISPEHGWGVARRRAFAAGLEERSLTGAEAQRLWREASDSIADRDACPAYDGLVLAPQLGLLPIGRDPGSGLWEFAELSTGAPAVRGRNGELRIDEGTGLVLVLIPGGSFDMGAQNASPDQPNYDPVAMPNEGPVHRVRLSPYFLAKHEMTQAQWLRITGGNPSQDNPETYEKRWSEAGVGGTLLHPVEGVSWLDCVQALARFGLVLPSEAQWERAARGGQNTPWWSGADPKALAGVANLHDEFAVSVFGPVTGANTFGLSDGYVSHAPVGSFAPNPFGLFDVHGNVLEWCLDGLCAGSVEEDALDPVCDPEPSRVRVYRGGSFVKDARFARVSVRIDQAPEFRHGGLGVRPARPVHP